LRLIHSIFLRNFRMKPEPPEIARVRRNLTNLRAPGGDILVVIDRQVGSLFG